jgi:hypothetical protein
MDTAIKKQITNIVSQTHCIREGKKSADKITDILINNQVNVENYQEVSKQVRIGLRELAFKIQDGNSFKALTSVKNWLKERGGIKKKIIEVYGLELGNLIFNEINLTSLEYKMINTHSTKKNYEASKIIDVKKFQQVTTLLLQSTDIIENIVGLIAATGRRQIEVFADYSFQLTENTSELRFTYQLKKKEGEGESFIIPVLYSPEYLVNLQKKIVSEINKTIDVETSDKTYHEILNNKYQQKINNVVKKHYHWIDLYPSDKLSSHLLRKIASCIAVFHKHKNELQQHNLIQKSFQEYLGHESYGDSANYYKHYVIDNLETINNVNLLITNNEDTTMLEKIKELETQIKYLESENAALKEENKILKENKGHTQSESEKVYEKLQKSSTIVAFEKITNVIKVIYYYNSLQGDKINMFNPSNKLIKDLAGCNTLTLKKYFSFNPCVEATIKNYIIRYGFKITQNKNKEMSELSELMNDGYILNTDLNQFLV